MSSLIKCAKVAVATTKFKRCHLSRSIFTLKPFVWLESNVNVLGTSHCKNNWRDTAKVQSSNFTGNFLHTRQISFSAVHCYEAALRPEQQRLQSDVKPDAVDIFKTAIRAVCPRAMIENVLKYNSVTRVLKVKDKIYPLNKNVHLVGFGKAVLGMARAVEDILGGQLVDGIISIPLGMQKEMSNYSEMCLASNSKITVFEGAANNEVDENSFAAAKAIQQLVSNLSETDLLIVLLSGGGSTLCPSPHPSMTLSDIYEMNRLLSRNGATMKEINTIRKNIEVLKGGGLALAAKPAKVVSLILSSVIEEDPVDLIASGPTYPTQPTPHHCIEILVRLGIKDKAPERVRKFLEKEVKQLDLVQAKAAHKSTQKKAQQDMILDGVQNVIVGDNSIACKAAASRAAELGYLPLVVTTELTGVARDVGALYTKLAKFVMICYDRKASSEPNSELTSLELQLVGKGIKKKWINDIANAVDMAHNMNKDICIIIGGETVVQVNGSGVGGRCLETALSAAIQMDEEFRVNKLNVAEPHMCLLCADSDGHDGVTQMAGAVVDQDFLAEVERSSLDMKAHLNNNDSFTLFNKINNGSNLINTNLTGTNIMNLLVIIVQKPREVKYQYI